MFEAIGDVGTWVAVVALAVLAAVIVLRASRWWLAAAVFCAFVAVELAVSPFDRGLWRAQALALLALAVALAWQLCGRGAHGEPSRGW